MEARRFRALSIPFFLATALTAAVADNSGARTVPLIVDTSWLAAQLGRPGVVVVEVGTKPQEYAAGHIPGAAYLELKSIYDTVNGIAGMFPGVETAVNALQRIGVGTDSTVVFYDARDSLWAARAFWALEYLGHENVHVLNGGLARWKEEGLAVSRETPAPTPARFAARVVPSRLADKSTVLACYTRPDTTIVDARTHDEYVGTDVRARRAGHIPGAVNVDWQEATTNDGRKMILDEQELSQLYQDAGVSRDKEVVAHCQTGVRAAHTYLVLRSLGYTNVALYDGSWEEWGNDGSTPIVAGQ